MVRTNDERRREPPPEGATFNIDQMMANTLLRDSEASAERVRNDPNQWSTALAATCDEVGVALTHSRVSLDRVPGPYRLLHGPYRLSSLGVFDRTPY
jgi:hypothetical protein